MHPHAGFYNRSIPVDVIVIDWMHWKVQGDWHFDPEYWPDPTAMVQELDTMGMKVMVTVWPWYAAEAAVRATFCCSY